MVIGMIGAFLFLLIQLILIVDFAHAWNEKWLENYEESQSKGWFAGKSTFNMIYETWNLRNVFFQDHFVVSYLIM